MNRLKAWIRSYFGFSRTETNGFLILLPLVALLLFSEPVYRWWFIHRQREPVGDRGKIDSLIAQWTWNKPADSASTTSNNLFSFDPNKATQKELTSLGFSEKLALRITTYRSKRGKFRVKSDLGKIYGMDSLLVKNLYPFIELPEKLTTARQQSANKPLRTRPANVVSFDLNRADTAQLIRIYGIGPGLSLRIINYRTRLGGFISMKQLTEVYGLDSSVIHQLNKKSFIEAGFIPRQININRADKKELIVLPYIRFSLANSILAYRFQHGDFSSVDELKRLVLLDEPTFQKIKPYLTVKD